MPNTIWVTGDMHGNPTRLNKDIFPEQSEMDRSDVVIVCGDFGLLWDYRGESKKEKELLDWLQSKPFTVVFVDGNHECFPRLNSLPVEERFGAPVGVVRENVFHLKRGNIYTINGKKVFAFGGASSHDISDGIIGLNGFDKDWKRTAKKWEMQGKWFFRVNGISWWPDEVEQNMEVYAAALNNLEREDNKVDYIITHCINKETQVLINPSFTETDKVIEFLSAIKRDVEYKHWFFGHYHINRDFPDHQHCLYEQIIRIL